jgi:hypothetical protein
MEQTLAHHIPMPDGWDRELSGCFRMIARRALRAKLMEAARIASRGDAGLSEQENVDGFKGRLESVCAMLDHAVAASVIDHDQKQLLLDSWIRTEAMFWLYNFPPPARREKLLDPAPGPQRFLSLRTRCQMLREIDEELRWGRQSGAAGSGTARTP